MPAAFDKQTLGGEALDACAQIDAMDRAPRAFAILAIKADDNGGAACGLFEARGDDANNAGMPAIARSPDEGGVKAAFLGLCHGGGAHGGFDIAAFGVELVKAVGHRAGLGHVIGGEKARAKVGLTNAPARIDARTKDKAKVIGVWGLCEAPHIAKRHKAGPFAPRHDPEPLAHKGAVHANQGRDIGNGGKCHEIKQRHQIGCLGLFKAELAVGLDQHKKDDRSGA